MPGRRTEFRIFYIGGTYTPSVCDVTSRHLLPNDLSPPKATGVDLRRQGIDTNTPAGKALSRLKGVMQIERAITCEQGSETGIPKLA